MYSLNRILKGLKNRPLRAVYTRLLARLVSQSVHPLEKLGNATAGWVVPVGLIERDWICYCGGVGEDITFDLELIERIRCQVYAHRWMELHIRPAPALSNPTPRTQPNPSIS